VAVGTGIHGWDEVGAWCEEYRGPASAKGPDRGKAAFYLDGRLVKTVDTYSASKKYRVVVFEAVVGESVQTSNCERLVRIRGRG